MNTQLNEGSMISTFEKQLIIPTVLKFRIGDFFHEYGDIPMWFDNYFKSIIEQVKDMEVFLEEEILLDRCKLEKKMGDSKIPVSHEEKPLIPLLEFFPILKNLLEDRMKNHHPETGLDNSGKCNIFDIDLTEIEPCTRMMSLNVFYGDGTWIFLVRHIN